MLPRSHGGELFGKDDTMSICGAKCENCNFKDECRGCEATGGKPFGGPCVAAEYIKLGGAAAYADFKRQLLAEVNALLKANDIPETDALYELPGRSINIAYPLPSGRAVKFLDESKVYLGCQIAFADMGVCYGVVADTTFILICGYSVNGSEPELIAYQKR